MGNPSSKLVAGKKVVVVVGGGYGGVAVARDLDASGNYNVVLIDRKKYFFHNIGALRATVQQSFAKDVMIPYDKLLTNGSVVNAEVAQITATEIRVHGQDKPFKFDYLIIATGSSYAFPAKLANVDSKVALGQYETCLEKIKAAKHIVVVGGGPVGIELVGELATEFKEKKVTLLHSGQTLLSGYGLKPELLSQIDVELRALKVNLLLGERLIITPDPTNEDEVDTSFIAEWLKKLELSEYERSFVAAGFDKKTTLQHVAAEDLKEMGVKTGHAKAILAQIEADKSAKGEEKKEGEEKEMKEEPKVVKGKVGAPRGPLTYSQGEQKLMTEKGTVIAADLVFYCTGTRLNSGSYKNTLSTKLDQEGRIKVNEYFQVEGLENVFAIGDCCNKEKKFAYKAGEHAKHVAKNLPLLDQKKTLKKYEASPYPGLFLSIGRNSGAAQLPTKGGKVFPKWLAVRIKSKDLFLDNYWSVLNNSRSKPSTGGGGGGTQSKNLAAAMELSEEDAEKLLKEGGEVPQHEGAESV